MKIIRLDDQLSSARAAQAPAFPFKPTSFPFQTRPATANHVSSPRKRCLGASKTSQALCPHTVLDDADSLSVERQMLHSLLDSRSRYWCNL